MVQKNSSNVLLEEMEEKPLKGVLVETFVKGYKEQSQMNVNTINNTKISSNVIKSLENLYNGLEQ